MSDQKEGMKYLKSQIQIALPPGGDGVVPMIAMLHLRDVLGFSLDLAAEVAEGNGVKVDLPAEGDYENPEYEPLGDPVSDYDPED